MQKRYLERNIHRYGEWYNYSKYLILQKVYDKQFDEFDRQTNQLTRGADERYVQSQKGRIYFYLRTSNCREQFDKPKTHRTYRFTLHKKIKKLKLVYRQLTKMNLIQARIQWCFLLSIICTAKAFTPSPITIFINSNDRSETFVSSSNSLRTDSKLFASRISKVVGGMKRVRDSLNSKERTRDELKIGIAGFYDRSSKLWEDVWGMFIITP